MYKRQAFGINALILPVRALGAAFRLAGGFIGIGFFVAVEAVISILEVGFVNTLRRVGNLFIDFINLLGDGFRAIGVDFGRLEGFDLVFDDIEESVEAASDNIVDFTDNIQDLTEMEPMLSSFEQTLESALDVTSRISELGSQAFDDLTDSLTDFVTTGRLEIRSFAQDVIREFIRIQIRSAFARSIAGFGGFTIPGLQRGGPVQAGQPYLVGEAGPELFVPSQSGQVVSNAQLQSGGGQTNITINAIDTQSFQTALARDPSFITSLADRGRRQQGRR